MKPRPWVKIPFLQGLACNLVGFVFAIEIWLMVRYA